MIVQKNRRGTVRQRRTLIALFFGITSITTTVSSSSIWNGYLNHTVYLIAWNIWQKFIYFQFIIKCGIHTTRTQGSAVRVCTKTLPMQTKRLKFPFRLTFPGRLKRNFWHITSNGTTRRTSESEKMNRGGSFDLNLFIWTYELENLNRKGVWPKLLETSPLSQITIWSISKVPDVVWCIWIAQRWEIHKINFQ